MKQSHNLFLTTTLSAVLLFGSSLALAGMHGERHRGDMDMADRLKLNDKQREIWNQMRQEQKEKFRQNSGKWQEKMQKRCQKATTDK